MGRLTLEQVSRESQNREGGSITSLHLSHRALSDVSCLISFQSLERLDISCNCLFNLEGLSSCINLKWLSVVENKLESLKGIEGLSKLTVLNAGKNKLQKVDEISSVTSLRAVILNDNNISSICKLDQLKYLNTVVLSRNPIYDIGDSLKKVKSISKLSLSHCQIQMIGSTLTSCLNLKEIRLAHNKITIIPSELALNVRLQNLDLGNNLIEELSDIKVLSSLNNLKNLNLQGNPISDDNKLANKVRKLVPGLRIFNAKPVERNNSRDIISSEKKAKKTKKSIGTEAVAAHNRKDVELTQNYNDGGSVIIGGIDDAETPFMDLIFLGNKTPEGSGWKNADEGAVPDAKHHGGLVLDQSRKKKRAKTIIGASALKLLSPFSDVGMGGPSTWAD